MYDLGPRVTTELIEEESIRAKYLAYKAVQGTQTHMKNPNAQGVQLSPARETRYTPSHHSHFVTCEPILQHPITGTDSRILGFIVNLQLKVPSGAPHTGFLLKNTSLLGCLLSADRIDGKGYPVFSEFFGYKSERREQDCHWKGSIRGTRQRKWAAGNSRFYSTRRLADILTLAVSRPGTRATRLIFDIADYSSRHWHFSLSCLTRILVLVEAQVNFQLKLPRIAVPPL